MLATIYHYITVHDYCPPKEFVKAVLNSPLPGSKAYNKMIDDLGLKFFDPFNHDALGKTGIDQKIKYQTDGCLGSNLYI